MRSLIDKQSTLYSKNSNSLKIPFFKLKVNNNDIEKLWEAIKSCLGQEYEIGTVFKTFKWYAPGRTDLNLKDTNEQCLYFNCASMAMFALLQKIIND